MWVTPATSGGSPSHPTGSGRQERALWQTQLRKEGIRS